jgi:hypothetical protein
MTRSPARPRKAGRVVRRLTISAALDVHAAEALELEIRHLARRHRVAITWRRGAARPTRPPASA